MMIIKSIHPCPILEHTLCHGQCTVCQYTNGGITTTTSSAKPMESLVSPIELEKVIVAGDVRYMTHDPSVYGSNPPGECGINI